MKKGSLRVILSEAKDLRSVILSAAKDLLLVASALGVAAPTLGNAQTPPTDSHRVDGRVVRGTRSGQEPVPNVWVVLHRVGSDTAGALDSIRTSTRGTYAFRYRPFGDSAAVYFVSASYGGIAYFTALHGEVVTGDDATITVFDTTSAPIRIGLGGRHLIVAAPNANGRRPIGEVYDLQNDTTVTLVARDSTPLWTTRLPKGAEHFQINPSGDIAAAAVTQRGDTVGLFAPLSPGVRQFAFSYELPHGAFPIEVRATRPTGVVEVLVQEQDAKVSGARLEEVDPVTTEGRTFRRFLAKDVPAGATFRVDAPAFAINRKLVINVVLATIAAAMLATLGIVIRRRATRGPVATVSAPRSLGSEAVLQAITALDVDFERSATHTDADREQYQLRRASLKAQLAAALAAERQQA